MFIVCMKTLNDEGYRKVLTIAGSSPVGGAGMQADIKTISACGCYATCALVGAVNEDTVRVKDIQMMPVDFVVAQIHSVLDDIGTDAVKIGMLHSSPYIEEVRKTLDEYPEISDIVLDPVMVAPSGDPLMLPEAVDTMRNVLVPRARVITPNIDEAEMLLGSRIESEDELPEAVRALAELGPSVLLKAGHLKGPEVIDVFYNGETGEMTRLVSPRLDTPNTHGTGCTLSAAFAAFLAKGESLDAAAYHAKKYVERAITAGSQRRLGHGHGPVHHFVDWW